MHALPSFDYNHDFANPNFFSKALAEGLKPDPELTVSEWAEENRILSSVSSAEAGPWRNERTPYLTEIMDCLTESSPVWKVIFMKGSQIGGSEVGNNWLGYIIDCVPAPFLMAHPTKELGQKFSKQRLDPLIEECGNVNTKIKPRKHRESSNTIMSKEFPGGILNIVGACSASSFRQMPTKYLMKDDLDMWPGDVSKEGDPSKLADGRTKTFRARRKIYEVSTPTIQGISRIEKSYEKSGQRKYYLPCPRCDFMQFLEWCNLKWPSRKPKQAEYVCRRCGRGIQERYKTDMLNDGRWIAKFPELSEEIAGFWLSSLYSPLGWYSWGDAAEEFLDVHKNPEELRVFINTTCAQTWKGLGEVPEWKKLYKRREKYKKGEIPSAVKFLTASVDVQVDRVELEIKGWGKYLENWSIDYVVISGDPNTDVPWKVLDMWIVKQWRHPTGFMMGLQKVAIDSGNNTQRVYNYCKKWPADKVLAIKGSDKMKIMVGMPCATEIKESGKKSRRYQYWPLGVSIIKRELYGFLRQEKKEGDKTFPYGYCHHPYDYDEEYFKQLTAEKLVPVKRRGFLVYAWEKQRDNEALDCHVYNRAMASLVGIDSFNDDDWERFSCYTQEAIQEEKEGEKEEVSRKKSQFWAGR
jgi:phage terminase large subunit GpA-like protein